MNLGIISRKLWAGFCMKEVTGKVHKEVTVPSLEGSVRSREKRARTGHRGQPRMCREDLGVANGVLSRATGDER